MLIPLTPEWRADRDRRRSAAAYVRAIRLEPDDADVRWLAGAATGGDEDHARWELRYTRWVLGLVVAQRDALDDRTGSEVLCALDVAMREDPNIDAGMSALAERQVNDRLAGYAAALSAHGGPAGGGERLGRVLLAFASDGARSAGAPLAHAVEVTGRYLAEANAALRTVYGLASLPEDLPPSGIGATPEGRKAKSEG